MVDMNSDHVLVVPDTPDRIQQSACPVSSSASRRDIDPSPRRRFRFKTRNNSMNGSSSQADALSVLPAHSDADSIFRQADVARTLAFPEGSEAKLPSHKSNKTTGTSLLIEKRAEKRVLDQSSSISNSINYSDAGVRRHSCQVRDGGVSQQDANHQNANFLGVGSVPPTIPVGKPRNRTGISIHNRLKAVAGPDICPGSSSEEVKDEMITNMIIAGSSSSPSVVPQRHVGQKRLVRNGCISPSNLAKRSVEVDRRQEMCSPSGFLHHQHPQHGVFATANMIDLTDNSPAITRHGSGVNISANIMDTRAAKRLRTDIAGEALVPPSEYVANRCSGVSLSGRNGKGKEISHVMLDSQRIGEANSMRVCLSSAGTSAAANSSSSSVNPEQGWRTTHNHTSKLPMSSMGKTTISSERESGSSSSAPFNLDHESAEGNNSICGATTIHTGRLGNRTIRIPGVGRKHPISSSHPGESSSALDEPRGSSLASSETTFGRFHMARRHNIPAVISIDDVSPEVRSNSSGRNNGTSVDPMVQAQLESDELLARQLQEQLYNETPRVAPAEDIDAVIAMSLQHEENAHRTSRAARRPQYNRRGAQRSRSNVYQNAVARANSMISHLQNAASVTLGLGAVAVLPGTSHAQPNIDLNDYDALLALDENNHQHTGASESQINSLPQSVVQSSSIEEPCAVCLENPSVGDTIRHLPCFHKFHKECIDEWLRRKKLCPICKSGIR